MEGELAKAEPGLVVHSFSQGKPMEGTAKEA